MREYQAKEKSLYPLTENGNRREEINHGEGVQELCCPDQEGPFLGCLPPNLRRGGGIPVVGHPKMIIVFGHLHKGLSVLTELSKLLQSQG